MKQFYNACDKALKQAQKRNVFGTIAWLTVAEQHYDRLHGQARARLELRLTTHLSCFIQLTVKACWQFWGSDPNKAFVELLANEGPLSPLVERLCPLPIWDKTVEGGSLAYRWSEVAQEAV